MTCRRLSGACCAAFYARRRTRGSRHQSGRRPSNAPRARRPKNQRNQRNQRGRKRTRTTKSASGGGCGGDHGDATLRGKQTTSIPPNIEQSIKHGAKKRVLKIAAKLRCKDKADCHSVIPQTTRTNSMQRESVQCVEQKTLPGQKEWGGREGGAGWTQSAERCGHLGGARGRAPPATHLSSACSAHSSHSRGASGTFGKGRAG